MSATAQPVSYTHLGVGEVNLNSLTASDAEFDTGVGDLYVTDCSFATCDVDGGTGNLRDVYKRQAISSGNTKKYSDDPNEKPSPTIQ